MDSLIQILAASTGASPVIGILYAEDFDDIPVASPTEAECAPASADLAPPPLTQDDLDRQCAAAVAAARLEWQAQSDQLRIDRLGAISAALHDAREAAEQVALATAEAAAITVLAMLSSALPQFCSEHGAAEVRALIERLLPTLRSEPRVVIRVRSEFVSELRREFADQQTDFTGTLTVLPAELEHGDVKVEWENGALSRDTRHILQAMQDALGQLGLQPHPAREPAPTRRMAHAE